MQQYLVEREAYITSSGVGVVLDPVSLLLFSGQPPSQCSNATNDCALLTRMRQCATPCYEVPPPAATAEAPPQLGDDQYPRLLEVARAVLAGNHHSELTTNLQRTGKDNYRQLFVLTTLCSLFGIPDRACVGMTRYFNRCSGKWENEVFEKLEALRRQCDALPLPDKATVLRRVVSALSASSDISHAALPGQGLLAIGSAKTLTDLHEFSKLTSSTIIRVLTGLSNEPLPHTVYQVHVGTESDAREDERTPPAHHPYEVLVMVLFELLPPESKTHARVHAEALSRGQETPQAPVLVRVVAVDTVPSPTPRPPNAVLQRLQELAQETPDDRALLHELIHPDTWAQLVTAYAVFLVVEDAGQLLAGINWEGTQKEQTEQLKWLQWILYLLGPQYKEAFHELKQIWTQQGDRETVQTTLLRAADSIDAVTRALQSRMTGLAELSNFTDQVMQGQHAFLVHLNNLSRLLRAAGGQRVISCGVVPRIITEVADMLESLRPVLTELSGSLKGAQGLLLNFVEPRLRSVADLLEAVCGMQDSTDKAAAQREIVGRLLQLLRQQVSSHVAWNDFFAVLGQHVPAMQVQLWPDGSWKSLLADVLLRRNIEGIKTAQCIVRMLDKLEELIAPGADAETILSELTEDAGCCFDFLKKLVTLITRDVAKMLQEPQPPAAPLFMPCTQRWWQQLAHRITLRQNVLLELATTLLQSDLPGIVIEVLQAILLKRDVNIDTIRQWGLGFSDIDYPLMLVQYL
ncbi:MAG: hypothetical protein MHM6MM_004534 [Cercozoa sp. M6MM]